MSSLAWSAQPSAAYAIDELLDDEHAFAPARAPGKRTLTASLQRLRIDLPAAAVAPAPRRPPPPAIDALDDPFAVHLGLPVQRKTAGDATADDLHAAAARGVTGAAAALPFLDRIQTAFGAHDVSRVQAHVGGAAAEGAAAIGARAYATGDHVAFAASPDLHTAAHEAAHVVQQRGGVQLDGGVGAAGDPYEQHADAVADLVVQGHSAEALLDRLAGGGGAGAEMPVQRLPSDYRQAGDLKQRTLGAFEAYARQQADWASGIANLQEREELRVLLAFARRHPSVLGTCHQFDVQDLLTSKIGRGGAEDADLLAYCAAAGSSPTHVTVRIEAHPDKPAKALALAHALRVLEVDVPGPILAEVVPETATYRSLSKLVDRKAVEAFAAYVREAQPILDARKGVEVDSIIAFRDDHFNVADLKQRLPTVRNYHRYQALALVGLMKNHERERGRTPLTMIVQSGLDHNGAFHRKPNFTQLIVRPEYVTLMVEGQPTLGDCLRLAEELAKQHKEDGQIDEFLLNGHASPRAQQIAGTTRAEGSTLVRDKQYVTASKGSSDDDLRASDEFVRGLVRLLPVDREARLVLAGCNLASNHLYDPLDPDHEKAQAQIAESARQYPNLVEKVRRLAAGEDRNKLDVRGSHGSTRTPTLVDKDGRLTLESKADAKLTGSKFEYATEGAEAPGVLRALLDVWGENIGLADKAIAIRLERKHGGWSGFIVKLLFTIIQSHLKDGELIRRLAETATALDSVEQQIHCTVAPFLKVHPEYRAWLFAEIWKLDTFARPGHPLFLLCLHQAWMTFDPSQRGRLIKDLEAPALTLPDALRVLDLQHIGTVDDLLPAVPDAPTRGNLILSIVFLTQQGAGAPELCKRTVKAAHEAQSLHFRKLIVGADRDRLLALVGASQQAALGPNVAPTRGKVNTVTIEPLTAKGLAREELKPTDEHGEYWNWIWTGSRIEQDAPVHVIGRAQIKGIACYAIEHQIDNYSTVFVDERKVKLT